MASGWRFAEIEVRADERPVAQLPGTVSLLTLVDGRVVHESPALAKAP